MRAKKEKRNRYLETLEKFVRTLVSFDVSIFCNLPGLYSNCILC